DGSLHLGVERLDLGGATTQPQPDDRGAAGGFALGFRLGTRPEEVRQRQAAEAQGTDLEEVTARGAVAVGSRAGTAEEKHGASLPRKAQSWGWESGRQEEAGAPLK